MKKCLGIVLGLLIFYNFSYSALTLIQKAGPGEMNWGKYKISAVGIGPKGNSSKGSLTEARKDAVHKLYETVLNLNLDCTTLVKDKLNKFQLKKLESLISKEFKMLDKPRYTPPGDCEIDVELALPGKIMDLLLPPTGEKLKELSGQNLPSAPTEAFTGLIIDATGLNLTPHLVPKIVNPKGEEIYGISWVERSWANTWGIVEYATSTSDYQRVGEKLQYLKALKIAEDGCSIVVSVDNLPKMLTAENLATLSRAKVILITDQGNK
ncbi:MAG TPA: hypothetical protein VJ165_01850 [candidate division Zixibacteria bacterium]|nr:hypothetical protein [candidate division Zixibacteria bacterium]